MSLVDAFSRPPYFLAQNLGLEVLAGKLMDLNRDLDVPNGFGQEVHDGRVIFRETRQNDGQINVLVFVR